MDGGTEDFAGWYDRAWPRLVAAVVVVAGDADIAHDACAEAFSRAWERWDGRLHDPDAWTYRVAVNLVRRRARRAAVEDRLLRRHHRPTEAAPGPEPHGPLWEAVAALPDRQRQVVALRYLADWTQPQIAAALGISTGTVASTLHDARSRLAAALTDTDPLPTEVHP